MIQYIEQIQDENVTSLEEYRVEWNGRRITTFEIQEPIRNFLHILLKK